MSEIPSDILCLTGREEGGLSSQRKNLGLPWSFCVSIFDDTTSGVCLEVTISSAESSVAGCSHSAVLCGGGFVALYSSSSRNRELSSSQTKQVTAACSVCGLAILESDLFMFADV